MVFEDHESYNNLKGNIMQTINLKPNASRKETNKYLIDTVSMIKTYNFSEEQLLEASKAGYVGGKYFTSAKTQEQLSATQAFWLMKTLIINLLNTRIEFIDSSILAVCLNIRTNAFNKRNIRPLLETKSISNNDIVYESEKSREEFFKLNRRGLNKVLSKTRIHHMIILDIIYFRL